RLDTKIALSQRWTARLCAHAYGGVSKGETAGLGKARRGDERMSRRKWTAVCSALLFGVVIAGAGVAPALNTPNQFCTGDTSIISGSKTADANITLDFGTGAVILQGTLTMAALGDGSVGSLTINARTFTISGAGQVRGFSSSANGGSFIVNTTGAITIND